MCDMTRSHVWHDSFTWVTWLIHMCGMPPSYVWHNSLICVTWLVHMCDMTRSCVWRDSFTCVPWLVHMYDMTHSYVWHDSSIRVTWLTGTTQESLPFKGAWRAVNETLLFYKVQWHTHTHTHTQWDLTLLQGTVTHKYLRNTNHSPSTWCRPSKRCSLRNSGTLVFLAHTYLAASNE